MARILLLTSNYPRWAGDSTTPFVLHLAHDLQELDWDVEVLAPHAPGANDDEMLDGVRVRRFHYLWPESMETVCYQGGALINLRRNRSNLVKLPALVTAQCVSVVHRLLSSRYDLLHSHWILPQGFVGSLCTPAFKVPHVITVHGGDIFGLRGTLMTAFKRYALRHATAVTVNSSVTRRAVDDVTPGLSALHTIPMGVTERQINPGHVAKLRKQFRRGNGPLVMFVGRLVEEKGISDLLQAIAMLASDLPDISAVIVGEGQDRMNFEILSEKIGVAERVTFAGWVSADEVPNYLAAADVFVGPSRTAKSGWTEAQGLTFLEAMLAGTPVIATRSGGIIDSVKHEETGLLVDENAPDQIASAVKRLSGDRALATSIRDRSRLFVQQRFLRSASANAFSKLFRSILEQQGG